MIKLDRVFKFYRSAGIVKIVLDHVSARFETGCSYGLMGVNGAGKSTTMRLIAGTELPNSGRVRRTRARLLAARLQRRLPSRR